MPTYWVFVLTNTSRNVSVCRYRTILRIGLPSIVKPRESLRGGQRDHLVYAEDYQYAIAREKQIKSWQRSKKNALVESANPSWADFQHFRCLSRILRYAGMTPGLFFVVIPSVARILTPLYLHSGSKAEHECRHRGGIAHCGRACDRRRERIAAERIAPQASRSARARCRSRATGRRRSVGLHESPISRR